MKKGSRRLLALVATVAVAILVVNSTRAPLYRFTREPYFTPMVNWLSPGFMAAAKRLDVISAELEKLPGIPPPAGSGTTGYLSALEVNGELPGWVEFTFPVPREIDAVSCVPAQQPHNFSANEALSLSARMEIVLELKGTEIRRIPFEVKAAERHLRMTLPFFASFDPVTVDTVRIEDIQPPGGKTNFAIGEFFMFSGKEPVAHEAEVAASSSRRGIPGVDIDYITDDQTPLGLPEIPGPHRYVGYRSEPKPLADFPIAVRFDWEALQKIDEVRLYPVGRLLGATTDAAGFPPEVELEYWNKEQESWVPLVRKSGEEMESPGWNPVSLRFPMVEADRIRLVFPKLWKATNRSAAILALAEIEPRFRGERLPAPTVELSSPPQDGRAIAGPDGSERYWGIPGLIDGMTSDGRIIGERDWLEALSRRAGLLIGQAAARKKVDALGGGLDRRLSKAALGLLLLMFAVPLGFVIRQRRIHLREMKDIRNRLAADLHDDLGSNLSAISIYAQRLRRQSQDTPECLDPMQRLIRESLGSLKEMVSFTTPQISRPISLVARLREIAEIHCGETPHEFEVDPDLENLSVSSAHRRCLRLFLKEAVHNAIRHSGADRIVFQIHRDGQRKIWLSIRDNGCGLPPEVLGKSTSLPTLRLRAEEMEATFRASNPPAGGSEVAVTIRPA